MPITDKQAAIGKSLAFTASRSTFLHASLSLPLPLVFSIDVIRINIVVSFTLRKQA